MRKDGKLPPRVKEAEVRAAARAAARRGRGNADSWEDRSLYGPEMVSFLLRRIN